MSDVILHPPVPFPEVLAVPRGALPGRDATSTTSSPASPSTTGTPTAWRSSRCDAGMRYLVPVTKHHDGFCWWDSDLTDRTERAARVRTETSSPSSPTRRAPTTSSSGSTTRCSTGGTPNTPIASGTSTRYLRPQLRGPGRAVPTAAALGRRALGPQRRLVAGRPRSSGLLRGDGERSGSTVWSTTGSARATPTTRSTSTTSPTRCPRGAWELCRGLSYSFCFNRAEHDDDHLSAPRARRDAHRGRGQGRQPAPQRRSEGGRHRFPRSRRVCCVMRARG